ncbi:hypothetical protein OS493_022569 [Desmophyllum pertusum]|uniref:Pentraxin (PTX) domain-containing protein n=1 Tax=Desmophyllum pertusum TaxID=174260 RepID=A0A9W9ZC09_9CNID|nr:hypothetical protein OS493_022569 [Desmophyllum pertusum]
MWDHVLQESDIVMLARSCRSASQGNMFQWSSLKDNVLGQLQGRGAVIMFIHKLQI